LDKKRLTLITLAHIVTDSYGGWIPILLPMLSGQYGIQLAASFPAIMALLGNFPQPFFGHYFDKTKKSLLWLAPLGAALFAGTFIFIDSYFLRALFLGLAGLSIGAFHPEATHIARSSGGEKKELSASIFLAGGTTGFALGALGCGALLHFFKLPGLLIGIIPGLAASVMLLAKKDTVSGRQDETRGASVREFKQLNKIPEFISMLAVVTLVVSFQSLVNTFLPSFLALRGFGELGKGLYTFFFVIPGSIGGIIAGRFVKEHGLKTLVVASQLLGIVSMVCFIYMPYPWYLIFIPLTGAFSLCSFPALVSRSFKHLPGNAGVAGGAVIGLTWGVAGILTQFAGFLAGLAGGISGMYLWLLLLPACGALLTLLLKF